MSPLASTLPELVQRCLQRGDEQGWDALVQHLLPEMASVARRSASRWGRTDRQQIEDLVQELFQRVVCKKSSPILRRIDGKPEHLMLGYLKVTMANLVHDHFRAMNADKRLPPGGLWPLNTIDPGLAQTAAMDRMDRDVLLLEIDEILGRKVSSATLDRDRRIFWFHHRQGMTAKEIASVPGIGLGAKGIESVLGRLTTLVKEELALGKGISAGDSYT